MENNNESLPPSGSDIDSILEGIDEVDKKPAVDENGSVPLVPMSKESMQASEALYNLAKNLYPEVHVEEWTKFIRAKDLQPSLSIYEWLASEGIPRADLYDQVCQSLSIPLFPLPSATMPPLAMQVWLAYLERYSSGDPASHMILTEPWLPLATMGPLMVMGHYLPHHTDRQGIPSELVIPVLLTQEHYEALHRVCSKRLDVYPPTTRKHPDIYKLPEEKTEKGWLLNWFEYGFVEPGERTQMEPLLESGDFSSLPRGYTGALNYKLLQQTVIPIRDVFISADIYTALPSALCERFRAVPFNIGPKVIYLASSAHLNNYAFEDEVNNRIGNDRKINWVYAEEADILAVLEGIRSKGISDLKALARGAMEGGLTTEAADVVYLDDTVLSDRGIIPDKAIERMVHRVIYQGVLKKASDIHFEQVGKNMRIRYRIDGQLAAFESVQLALMRPVVTKIKVMSRLDVAQSRMPQDGRITLNIKNRTVDLRVSIIPAKQGYEKVVIRIIDKTVAIKNLADLKLPANHLDVINDALGQDKGLVLITGPTGSGKTSTLYALLNQLNSEDNNVITAEDPVELEIEGLTQTSVNPAIGINFASLLKYFMRQDPDVIMLGEIRDLETCQSAIYAALTGHLVLSTVHTNDATRAVSRLVSLGIEPYLLADALLLLQAQRLVRTLHRCAQPTDLKPNHRETFLQNNIQVPANQKTLSMPMGCAECQKGFLGRAAIMELVPVNDELRSQIALNRPIHELLKIVQQNPGHLSLYQEGLKRVLSGHTTFDQIESLKPVFV